jgi:putative hydrolase of the HAD superfamily
LLALEKQWWRDVVWNVFAPLGPFPRFTDYFDALFARFAEADAWVLYPETLDALTALRSRGLVLGVISNFDSRLFGLLEGLGLARFFAPVVISSQAGAAKPETAIFHRALTYHGLRPDEALHVGDNYEADVVGARTAGLTPVWVDRRAHDLSTDGYLWVKSLAEIPAILDG